MKSVQLLLPLPDALGIEQTKALYRERGYELTDEEAYDALSRVMRFLFLTSELAADATVSQPNTEQPKNEMHSAARDSILESVDCTELAVGEQVQLSVPGTDESFDTKSKQTNWGKLTPGGH